ncbi:aldehyde dehydrogenase family protein [Pseudarthrobacter sp. NKDBFgelt]|uniref:aldehyde dehydrogenase family protein n=1 Tax=Pseudarthrobacter sp. NKDBFgelt TaxID=3384443 RepID=UPI0038D39DD0
MHKTREQWENMAQSTTLPAALWSGGAWSDSLTGQREDVISPRDGRVITSLPAANGQDINEAVTAARAVFDKGVWSRASARQRGNVLLRWADLIHQHRDELALLISLEMGKPINDALQVELKTTEMTFRWYGEVSDKLMDESPRGLDGAVALVTREPIGVVGVITPWNFPLTLSSWKVAAGLVAGNSLVVKPAQEASLSLLRLAQLGSEAGLPDGVLHIVTGAGSIAGTALARHQDVDCLAFTGSPGVGKKLLQYSAESNAKPVWLELGGKSPHVVFADAPDLEKAADAAAWAITFNAGQMCTAGSRLIVQRDIADDFTASVAKRVYGRRIGDPLDPATEMGPLVSSTHRVNVLQHIANAEDDGATRASGLNAAPNGQGYFVDPVIFTDVQPGMRLFQEEVFGPVLAVTTFDTEDEALSLANNSAFGLGSAVWTSDLSRAHRFSRSLVAGTVWVNCYEEGGLSVPFGGRKLSGHGSDRSVHGLDKYTVLKTTWINL